MPSHLNENTISIPLGRKVIQGDLFVPLDARGLVIFAHGSGSSRFSPRNQYVGDRLNEAGLATLLIDLLTLDEEAIDNRTAELRFNIGLLADRLIGATDWAREQQGLASLRLAYFGASTGAAAALVAAAKRSSLIEAIVSRGGRPDLAAESLPNVAAPTLLIVGEFDQQVIELNRQAAKAMTARTRLQIVPGATHLFEEPGALTCVASLAQTWLEEHLTGRRAA